MICDKCEADIVRNGPFGWMHRQTVKPTHVVVPRPTVENYTRALADASLGVRHIWANQHCLAYQTYDPHDCTCNNR